MRFTYIGVCGMVISRMMMMMMTKPGTRCAVPVDTCVCVYCNIIITNYLH